MSEFDIDEATALCGIFGIGIGLHGAHLYRIDHWWGRGREHYDWAYLHRLDREEWTAAVAHLVRHNPLSPAHDTWQLSGRK